MLLLEAGGDPRRRRVHASTPGVNSLPDDYDVPAFHRLAARMTASAGTSSSATTRTGGQEGIRSTGARSGKRVDGVLYPRAGTLGGCTAHNAMISGLPAQCRLGSARGCDRRCELARREMRCYFERLERCTIGRRRAT